MSVYGSNEANGHEITRVSGNNAFNYGDVSIEYQDRAFRVANKINELENSMTPQNVIDENVGYINGDWIIIKIKGVSIESANTKWLRGGYEVVTPSVTLVTLGAEMHNAVQLQTNCWNYTVESRAAFFRRTRCKARRLIRT